MLHYIIQTIAFQLFFLIVYDLFLKKETFFNWNRTYLLVTATLSLIIPFIKISSLKHIISQEYIINLPEIFIGNVKQLEINPIQLSPIVIDNKPFWSWELIFYFGVGIATFLFAFKLIKLLILLKNNPKQKDGNLFIVRLLESNMAFSFFNYIFLGDYIKRDERKAVLKHEMVHVKQRHTLDLLFFELLRILFWYNPLVYMYQNRIMSLHEFIADAQAVKHESKNQYYQNLLSQVFQTKNMSFINPFFKKSLIKKRISMLQKSKSKQVSLFKYVLLIPLVFGMLVYTSCEKEEANPIQQNLTISEQVKTLKLMIESKEGGITEKERKELLSLVVNSESEKHRKITSIEQYETMNYVANSSRSEIPFKEIDQAPIFPGCENLKMKEGKDCFSKNISMHVSENFNTKLANELNLVGKQRINVIFKINKEGDIVAIRSRAPHPKLEDEAIRVIKTLPKFTPGEHNGKKVNVPYSLPIIFEVTTDKLTKENN